MNCSYLTPCTIPSNNNNRCFHFFFYLLRLSFIRFLSNYAKLFSLSRVMYRKSVFQMCVVSGKHFEIAQKFEYFLNWNEIFSVFWQKSLKSVRNLKMQIKMILLGIFACKILLIKVISKSRKIVKQFIIFYLCFYANEYFT